MEMEGHPIGGNDLYISLHAHGHWKAIGQWIEFCSGRGIRIVVKFMKRALKYKTFTDIIDRGSTVRGVGI